jgi:hypothetical protein
MNEQQFPKAPPMSLDLIAAKHQREIHKMAKSFPLEEDLHEWLLSFAKPKNEFPVLHQMDDYYADTIILLGELEQLKNEVVRAVSLSHMKDSRIAKLLAFIDTAISEGNNLYAMAD